MENTETEQVIVATQQQEAVSTEEATTNNDGELVDMPTTTTTEEVDDDEGESSTSAPNQMQQSQFELTGDNHHQSSSVVQSSNEPPIVEQEEPSLMQQSQFELTGDEKSISEQQTSSDEGNKEKEDEETKQETVNTVKEEEKEEDATSNSITQSTVFISQSQIEEDQKPPTVSSTTNEPPSTNSSSSSSSESGINEESANNTTSDEQFVDLTNSVTTATAAPTVDNNRVITPVDEVEKLVRHDYENLSKSQIDREEVSVVSKEEVKTTAESSSVAAAVVAENKPVRRLENEEFDKILGNDSLQKKIVQYGQEGGEMSKPNQGQMVTVSFEAYLNEKRDKLVDHNDNLSFILGDNDVISGLDMAVCLMDLDEKAELIVEARHGYGSVGKLPDIPPNATLFIKVHLKKIIEMEDLGTMRPVERLSLAEAKKLRGNFFYNRQEFHLGIISYRKGINYLLEENLRGDEEPKDLEKILELQQSIRMNLALSYFKLAECREALNLLNQVLEATQQKHIKALYIKGKVLLQLGETEEAIKSLDASLRLDPNNAEVRKELSKAQTMRKAQYENEKRMYQKMISGVSKAEEQLDRIKSKSSQRGKKTSESSSYVGYMAIGLLLAAASVGAALFARSRNFI